MTSATALKLVIAVSVFVFLLTLTLKGCEPPPVPLKPDNELFRVAVPEGWLVRPGPGLFVAVGEEWEGDRPDIMVTIIQLEEPMSVGAYFEQHVAMIGEKFQNVTMEPVVDATLGGQPAVTMMFTHTVRARPPMAVDPEDGQPSPPPAPPIAEEDLPTQERRAWVVGMVHEDRFYSIIFGGAADRFEGYRPTFERVIDSFELKPPNVRGRGR